MKICTPRWAVEAAAEIGARMAERIGGTGVRVLGDLRLLSVVDETGTAVAAAPRIAPEAAAQALYGALAAAAAAPVRHTAAAKSRTVHQTSSGELVRVLGHRCLKRLRLR